MLVEARRRTVWVLTARRGDFVSTNGNQTEVSPNRKENQRRALQKKSQWLSQRRIGHWERAVADSLEPMVCVYNCRTKNKV